MKKKGNVSIVVDLDHGDSGKGRICDYLNKDYDASVRFGGGPNSGHVCVIDGEKYTSQLLPVMALRNKICVLSSAVLVNVDILKKEIKESRIDIQNVYIDYRCPIITKEHIEEDKIKGEKIGTTKNGIGPCARDHIARVGIRYKDIFKLDSNLPIPIDTRKFLYESIKSGKSILFEGNQGYNLDINFGDFPFVTSGCCLSGGVMTNAGIPWNFISCVYGVCKFYSTRVGEGNFQTEIKEEILLNKIRKAGNEYGSVTQRPRRIGWMNLPKIKEACEVNGVTELVMTKLDVLNGNVVGKTGLMKVFFGYGGKKDWRHYASGCWNLHNVKKKKDIPKGMMELIEDIQIYCETPITMISLGPERENLIYLK